MTTEDFEIILNSMTKPEMPELKHEALVSKLVVKANDRSVVSIWWLSIPLYLIAALVMKHYFVPSQSLISILHDFTKNKSHTAILVFLVLPLILIVINVITIKQLYFLYSSLTRKGFLKVIAIQVLVIFFSLFVLAIYFL